MNALKELLEKKRQAAQGQQVGERRYAKQSDLEEQRLKRLREEEQQEREEKVWVSDLLHEAPPDLSSPSNAHPQYAADTIAQT